MQLLQRVWEEICVYHCCQPQEGSLLMACDKWYIFLAVSILACHQKCSPSLQRARYFDYSYERIIFSSNVIPDFKHFSFPCWCEPQTSWRFSQRESMLSLAFPDQVQHVVQPRLNKGCKTKHFSNISWAPGCLGVDFIIYRWSCYIYTLSINTQTFYCSQDLIPVEFTNLTVVVWDYCPSLSFFSMGSR